MKNIKRFGPETLGDMSSKLLNMTDIIERHNRLLSSTMVTVDLNPVPFLMFHPNKGFKIYWNMVVGFCLIYTCIVTPFVLAFVTSKDFDQWFFIDSVLTGIFFVDVLITLNTAYSDQESKIVVDRCKIFTNYLKGWMLVDIVACLPYDLIQYALNPSGSRSGYNTLSKLIRLKNLPRLFRMSKVLTLLKNSSSSPILDNIYYFFSLSHSGVRLIRTISMILLSLHIVACLWYFIARFYEFSPDTWIVRFNLVDSSTFDIYLACFYWALTTLSTIGYGDITPRTTGEIILAMFWMIVAIYFLSFAISSLSSMISQNDGSSKKHLDKKLTLIEMYCEENKLPRKMKIQMKRYVKETSEKKLYGMIERKGLFDDLSTALKIEISNKIHNGALVLFEILRNQEDRFIYTVVPLMGIFHFPAQKLVYDEGDFSSDIYFLISGKAHYVSETQLKFKVIKPGNYFGDIEVTYNVNRRFSIMAAEESSLWVMDRALIKIIREDFPKAYIDIEAAAKIRDKGLIHDLAEMVGISRASELKVFDLGKIREFISDELKRLLKNSEAFNESDHGISRIEDKLETCKALLSCNQDILKRIEKLVVQLTPSERGKE